MKKFVAMILTLLMLFVGTAVAEIDLSSMTAEELQNLINQARLEMTKFHPAVADGTVLYEDENIRMTFTSVELDDYGDLAIHVVVENLSEQNLTVALENSSCNGWDLDATAINVSAGKKAKDAIWFFSAIDGAEIESAEDLQDVEADLFYADSDTYDRVIDPIHVTWIF